MHQPEWRGLHRKLLAAIAFATPHAIAAAAAITVKPFAAASEPESSAVVAPAPAHAFLRDAD